MIDDNQDIIFEAHFGDEIKTVTLSNPAGSHSEVHHDIDIDGYYAGQMVRYDDGWAVYFNTDDFTQSDADVLLDKLKEKLGDEFDNYE